MKRLKNLTLLALMVFAINASAQTDKATTQKIVDAKNFIFVATSAIPMNSGEISGILNKMSPGTGGNINLSGNTYDLSITPDSVVAYLPYYGRSFNASINNDRDENGYKFKSKDFTYKNSKRKKGGWEITINPKDTKDNPKLNLTVFTNGYATLTVNSNNKQSISYNGYIDAPKEKH